MPDAIVGGSAVAILTNLYDLRDLGLIDASVAASTDEATLQAVWDENNMAQPVGDHDTVIDEYLGEAFRAYLTDPDWFKVHFPALADALARELNAAPRLRGFVQFN